MGGMTRNGFLGALALALLLSACAPEEPPKAFAPEISYLPDDSIFVVGVDAVRLRQTPLYRSLDAGTESEEPLWRQVKAFLEKLGVSPEENLERVLFAHRGPSAGPGSWVLVLRGRFDPQAIEAKLEEPDARMSTEMHRRWTLHNLVEVPGVGDLSLAIIDSTALALGGATGLRKVLDIRDGTAPSLITNTSMTDFTEGIEPAAQIWAVMDAAEVYRALQEQLSELEDGISVPTLKEASSLGSGRFWALLSEDLALALDVEAASREQARNLAEALEGLLALVKIGGADADPDAMSALGAVRVNHDEAILQVRMELEGATFRRLREKVGSPPSGAIAYPAE